MHIEAMQEMKRIVSGLGLGCANVLDVGSYDVNGSYRGMIESRGWKYTGLDVSSGPNVDLVSEDKYSFPIGDGEYDLVITGSTMEHVEAIWLWIPELVRVLSTGGHLVILTHTSWEYHPYPVDCWRIMPDGMMYLLESTGVLSDIEISMFSRKDISAVARKI